MASMKLVFTNPINTSLQAKATTVASSTANADNGAWDVIYFTRISAGKQEGEVYKLGNCIDIIPNKGLSGSTEVDSTTTYIVDVEIEGLAQTPDAGDFIFFGKENKINVSGVRGYYAEVEMKNDSTQAAKLFSVGSEVSQSSK